MEARLHVPRLSMSDAIGGMRPPFLRAFGRSLVGQKLAGAAWSAFHAALTQGCGIDVAASHAHAAVEERNTRIALVARWTPDRMTSAVRLAARRAADAA